MSIRSIKNIYTQLIINCQAEVDDWLNDYIAFSNDVAIVSAALNAGNTINSNETYKSTSFVDEPNPWLAFAERLLYTKDNGISSRGQSVLSEENFNRFIENPDFVKALAELIKNPSKDNFTQFGSAWDVVAKFCGTRRNPLRVNRTLAACTTNVSCMVDGSKFETIYWWLNREGFLGDHPKVDADWYEKNEEVMGFLRDSFANEPEEQKPSMQLLSIFLWKIYENISNPFTLKKQVVKYGAPGTGKTFTAKQETSLLFAIWQEKYGKLFSTPFSYGQCSEVVQFHPSYGYEDFIEGLRPVLVDGQPQLKLQNGIFKKFCRQAGQWEIDVYGIPEVGPGLAAQWCDLTVENLKFAANDHLIDKKWGKILELDAATKIADVIPPFFFIIDEINRAELSRVLGELMICIEYRGVEQDISTQYAELNSSETAMLTTKAGHRFFIPHNVYIVGTMNTIDRSVESFDLALRRRFRWERIEPDMTLLRYHLKQRDGEHGNSGLSWVDLATNLTNLNASIKTCDILGADYEIGHAYLMNLRYPQTLNCKEVRKNVWEDSIRPLLEEYLRGSGQSETLISTFAKDFGIV